MGGGWDENGKKNE